MSSELGSEVASERSKVPVVVRLLSKFERSGASSRLRMLQFLPMLAKLGISVDHHPLLSNAYVDALFEGRVYAARMLAGRHYLRRARELWTIDTGDLDWVEGEVLPFFPRYVERACTRTRRPFVAEYDDALFHRYGLSNNALVRTVLGRKIDMVMRDAACVIAGNRYLAEHAQQVGARRVEVIPTVVDSTRYLPVVHRAHDQLVIGWIGSPVTQHYLYAMSDLLREVCIRYGAVLRLVGPRADIAARLRGVPLERFPWSEQSETALLSGMDIGIMPLMEGPWEQGKCGYKLIQYMASGLPVLATPVGANRELVEDNVNGFLPVDLKDWGAKLSLLLDSAKLRQRLGSAGRLRVETELCVQVQAPRLAKILHEVAGR